MPKIQPYEAGIVGDTTEHYDIKSTAGRWEGLAKLGAGIASGSEKVADAALQFQFHKQLADGKDQILKEFGNGLGSAKNMSQSFNPETTDPSDLTKDFRSKTESVINGISDPRAAAQLESFRDQHEIQIQKAMFARNGQLQAQEYKGAMDSVTGTLTASAYNNPTSYTDLLDTAKNVVDGLPDHLGVGKKNELYNDLSRSIRFQAANGAIKDDPEKAQKDILENKYGLSGPDLETVSNRLDRQLHALDRQRDMQAKQMETQKTHAQLQTYMDTLSKIDSGAGDYNDITDAERLEKINPIQAKLARNRLDSLIAGAYQGSDTMARDAEMRLRSGEITDFQTLTQMYNGGKNQGLTQAKLKYFSQVYLAPKGSPKDVSQQFAALSDQAAKSLIMPSRVPWGDTAGLAQWGKAITAMHEEYNSQVAKGVSPTELLTPGSKNYLGNMIPTFQRSPSEVNQHAIEAIHNPAASLERDKTYPQPVGANGKLTPMPTTNKLKAAATTLVTDDELDGLGPQPKKGTK